MGLENLALFETHNLPIRHVGEVHNGKVRSVYWLPQQTSDFIIKARKYGVPEGTQLGVMVISDRISAFDVIWGAVPGKGASLNQVAQYWFGRFDGENLAGNHILDVPHPLVWMVQKAEPVLVEGVARQYITGSMWRDYKEGKREFCGNILPGGLLKNQKLDEVLYTPTTKGNLSHIPGIPNKEDAKISRKIILEHWKEFGFKSEADVDLYEKLLRQGYELISNDLADVDQLFVDTKFELGYVQDNSGEPKMIYIDEIGTPDSSRMWDARAYFNGQILENSKEGFRQFLLSNTKFRPILLDDDRMPERRELARTYQVPEEEFMKVSVTYRGIAEKITGEPVPDLSNAREEILDSLAPYGLVV